MTAHVVFVAGSGRCGSTVFELAMAQALGAPSTGELVTVWQRGILEDRLCSCGETFGGCPFWQAVVATDPAAFTEETAQSVAARTELVMGAFGPLRCFTAGQRRRLESIVGEEWARAMRALYRGVAVAGGSELFTDSSKAPVLAVLLSGFADMRVDVVHLVRDPRSVARSWKRPHSVPPGVAPMPHRSGWKSAIAWSLINEAAMRARPAMSGSYALVRYEDFVRAPVAVVEDVRQALGLKAAGVSHVPPGPHSGIVETGGVERSLVIEPASHSMSGNPPVRLTRTPFEVGPRPSSERSRFDDLAVSALTFPLLGRFEYPRWPTRLP